MQLIEVMKLLVSVDFHPGRGGSFTVRTVKDVLIMPFKFFLDSVIPRPDPAVQ